MSNNKREEEIETKEKNVIIDNFDFVLINKNDMEQIKKFANNNKINDDSTNISEEMKNTEQSISKTIFEINSENDKNSKIIKAKFLYMPFISLDTKNYFIKTEKEVIEQITKKLNTNYQDNNLSQILEKNSKTINKEILNHLFSGIKQDFFSISTFIWKSLNKNKLLKKLYIEKSLIYFYNRKDILKEKIILINVDFIKNCGSIIAHIYKRLKKNNNIKDKASFENAINKVIEQNVKVKYDFDNHFLGKNLKPENLEILNYFKKIRSKYFILPEVIYLIDLFSPIKKIIIDINISEKEYNQQLFYYYILCIFHIQFLFKNIETIKFSIFNEEIFNNKYKDFEMQLYILKYFTSYKINKKCKYKTNINKSYNKTEESFLNEYKLIDVKKQNNSNENLTINKDNKNNFFLTINKNEHKKEIPEFIDNILEMILITIFSLNYHKALQNLELKLIDTYNDEIKDYFEKNLKLKIENFGLFDLIYNKLIKLKSINFELNLFDLITFRKLLEILYNNIDIHTLKLSFFASDYFYSSPYLYKIYQQNVKAKIIKHNYNEKNHFNDIFYKKIFPHFSRYLSYLFEIIKNKKLSTISLNINIPSPILNDEKYIIIIIKFIINIFILCYNDKDSEARELSILSPPLIIDGRKYLFFDEFLQSINIKSQYLLILNIRLKFYYIKNIYKFIPEKLRILNIGDFDIFSLKFFVNNITDYKFIKHSSLQQLSIKLNDTIIKFSDELQLIIAKLFNINIQNLLLYFYTNVQINLNEFQEIINLLQNNWIFNYVLSFNYNSNEVIKNNYLLTKELKYIIPKEPKISRSVNIVDYKEDANDNEQKQLASFSYINFFLRNLINKANNSKEIDFYLYKKICSNIFIYLYIAGIPIINFYEKDI